MISNVAAQLELPPAWTIHDIFHTGLLTPFRETSQYGDNFPSPPPDVIDGEEEYEVEAIINLVISGRNETSNTSSNGRDIPRLTTPGNADKMYLLRG